MKKAPLRGQRRPGDKRKAPLRGQRRLRVEEEEETASGRGSPVDELPSIGGGGRVSRTKYPITQFTKPCRIVPNLPCRGAT